MTSRSAGTTDGPSPREVAPLVLFGALPTLAALGPLLTVSGGLFGFRLACGFVIAHAVVFLMEEERWRRSDVWLVGACLSFAVAGLAGLTRLAPGSDNPYTEFLAIMVGLLTALAARAWQRRVPGILQALARGWVVAGLVSSAIALWEIATGSHLPGYLAAAAPAPAATFGNPNALAMFVVMANVWAIPVRRLSGARWRVSTWVLALVSAPILYLADARLAMVVWVAVLGASVWFVVSGSHRGSAYLIGAALPTGVGIAVVLMAPVLSVYAVEAATAGTSGGVRQALTAQGLGFAVEQRGLPTWPGAFEALMLDHGDLASTAGLINAHNTWVEMLVQYGLLSLLLVLGCMVACVAGTPQPRGEALVAVATILALGVVNSSSLDDASFWLFFTTLTVLARSPRDTIATEGPHKEVPVRDERLPSPRAVAGSSPGSGKRDVSGEGQPCT